MALLTISGETASGWEEVARGAASLLQFELVTEARLAQWVAEEFGSRTPARAGVESCRHQRARATSPPSIIC